MTRFDYKRYLASREWAILRESVRARAGGRCERCWIGQHEDTHHLTYERIGQESLDDLLAVCAPCHDYLSGHAQHDPMMAAARSLNILHLPTLQRIPESYDAPAGWETILRLRPDQICVSCRNPNPPYAIWSPGARRYITLCQYCLIPLAKVLGEVGQYVETFEA